MQRDESRNVGVKVPDLGIEDALFGIDGWLHLDEAAELARCVLAAPSDAPLGIVEIGSWKGRSTVALALAAQSRGDAAVVAIDPHLGDNGEWMAESPTYEEFLRNVRNAGVESVVLPIRRLAHHARSEVTDGSVGVLFVDGSHRYEDVRQDIEDWTSSLVDGAIIAFNDSSKPGVYRAICEQILDNDQRFRAHRLVRSTVFFRLSSNPMSSHERTRLRHLRWTLRARRFVHPVVAWLPAPLKTAGNRISARTGAG